METHQANLFDILYIAIGTFEVAKVVWGIVIALCVFLGLKISNIGFASISFKQKKSAIG